MQTDFEPLKLFLEICTIPHPSTKAYLLKEWIKTKAQEFGAKTYEDKAGNLLCSKGLPKICLQAHYDMVYVGDCENFSIQPYCISKDNTTWLKARSSSLGADNGAAIACILLMLRDFENLECLFTSDEEIGMIGANNIELKVQSPFMINCDSEDIQEIIFSCAGGYDLQASKSFKSLKIPKDFTIHEIRTKNFIGGHSGIEIHKHIPNAILELAKIAKRLEGIILSFIGGEKRNSIPTHATLKIALPPQSQSFLQSIDSNFFDILRLNNAADFQEGYQCEILIDTLLGLSNGVLKGDTSPILSSNLGILRQKDNAFTLVVMGRGNQEKLMQDNLQSQKKFLEKSGFDTQVLDYYAPWEKEESDLLFKVRDIYQKNNPNTLLKSIHAGLECGILKQKYPNIQFVSIGPTILHPHSLQESLDIQSFKTFWHLLNQILLSYA